MLSKKPPTEQERRRKPIVCYYFVKDATTAFGPLHFAVAVSPGQTIVAAVEEEARTRGTILCHDWTAEPIDESEYRRLVGG
jgi:hypothetical protein